MESEHAVMAAAVASEMTGARTFTASSSQGLELMHEILPIASGTRSPLVMVNVSRGLSAPITLWCFTKDAKVLMSDLTYKRIIDVKKGDKVLGVKRKYGGGDFAPTKVLKTFCRDADKLVTIKTNEFELTCTKEHKFYYHPGHSRWAQANSLKDKKLKWLGFFSNQSKEFKRGWLAGVIDGDGCFSYVNVKKKSKNRRYFRFEIHVKDEEIIDNIIKYASSFGFNIRKHNYRQKYSQYGAIISVDGEAKKFRNFLKKSKDVDFCRGYLAGIYDAEGTGPYAKEKALLIYNSDGKIIDAICECLSLLKFKFKKYLDKRGIGVTIIHLSNAPRFFVECRPVTTRKRDNIFNTTIKAVKTTLKVHDVKPLVGNKKVYNIETETKNYIVNGLIVHNCDHNDFLSIRDCGWLMFCCETNQEVLDTIPIAYKVSENQDVLLPSMVNMDGFVHSYTRTEVEIPDQKKVDRFLPKLRLKTRIDVDNPYSLGIPVMGEYSYFRTQLHKAQLNALKVTEDVQKEWTRRFGRRYGLVERFHLNDADVVVVGMGANSTNMKAAVSNLRNRGIRAGFLRLRLIRPWPLKEIKESLEDVKKILVIDQNLAPGIGGILYPEVRSAVASSRVVVSNFVAGLGGKPVSQKDYETMIIKAKRASKPFRRFLT